MWLLLYAVLALPIVLFAYFEFAYSRHKRILGKLNGPPALPLLGNAHQMGKDPSEILDQIFEWWHQYGRDNYRFWIGYYSNVLLTNPKSLEFVLSSNTLIQKSDIYDMLHPWLGLGLLTSSGNKWHKHRKMITPSFHFNILQDFYEVMNESSTKFIAHLKNAAAGDNILDFQDWAHYLTLDVICETAMGVPINAMDNNDSAVVKAFKDMCYNINMRAFHPLKRSNFMYRFAPDYPHYEKTLKILQDFTNEVIAKRIAAHRTGAVEGLTSKSEGDEFKRKKLAFLDTLLSSSIDGRPLTQHEIYEEVSTFMFEGHDTTTSGVAFAVYLLSRHPEEQRKIYEEQLAVMGDDMKRDSTFQEIAEMKYLDLFIKEAQRLYPSVPFIGRYTDKEYVINGQTIPKGTTLNIGIVILGYDDRTFTEPHRFWPERFELQRPGPFEYVPFSAGPRNCIGQKFALLEIKTVVSKIVRSFEVLPALDGQESKDGYINTYLGLPQAERLQREQTRNKYDPILSAVLTLKSKNGLHLRLRERK
ncbi:cytochrome P450 4e2-like [Scaptodrosophila lebanonensis]|uniref:Cytochrome P450 4e2-like n=1 Tax=Drosophila lebanonensis TaxID=7225 RepID=A0A6J2UM86_DROLE|nr:cytochrome P450 4e2-like [Scaptodrosophila lebanonensis]